jgi:hypothetical protein
MLQIERARLRAYRSSGSVRQSVSSNRRGASEALNRRGPRAPQIVAGIEGDDKSRGTIVFEPEDAARSVAGQINQEPGESVTLDSVDVGEVVESV